MEGEVELSGERKEIEVDLARNSRSLVSTLESRIASSGIDEYRAWSKHLPANLQPYRQYSQDGILYACTVLRAKLVIHEQVLKIDGLFVFCCSYIQGNSSYPRGMLL
jgi:hypothetical protein